MQLYIEEKAFVGLKYFLIKFAQGNLQKCIT
jgi:hypothetical protein